MNVTVVNIESLPEILSKLISTEKVRVKEINGIIELVPIEEPADCTSGLRGLFASYPEMSVDKFLERKHADKEIEL